MNSLRIRRTRASFLWFGLGLVSLIVFPQALFRTMFVWELMQFVEHSGFCLRYECADALFNFGFLTIASLAGALLAFYGWSFPPNWELRLKVDRLWKSGVPTLVLANGTICTISVHRWSVVLVQTNWSTKKGDQLVLYPCGPTGWRLLLYKSGKKVSEVVLKGEVIGWPQFARHFGWLPERPVFKLVLRKLRRAIA